MVDIHTIINEYRTKWGGKPSTDEAERSRGHLVPTTSEIPDLFFDEILVLFKLTRIEVIILMYLYRGVWCRPNIYKDFGISGLLSYANMARELRLQVDDIYAGIRKIEEYGFISTIRPGQYFVRRYFTKKNDEKFGQNYDDFDT